MKKCPHCGMTEGGLEVFNEAAEEYEAVFVMCQGCWMRGPASLDDTAAIYNWNILPRR